MSLTITRQYCLFRFKSRKHYSKCFLCRGTKFRAAFQEVLTPPSFFQGVPYMEMSGTITTDLLDKLPTILGMWEPKVVSVNPERSNIFLDLVERPPSLYQEAVIKPECQRLFNEREEYPVTLIYCSFPCNSRGQRVCANMFGKDAKVDIYSNALFSSIFTNQSWHVNHDRRKAKKKKNPGFDSCFALLHLAWDLIRHL